MFCRDYSSLVRTNQKRNRNIIIQEKRRVAVGLKILLTTMRGVSAVYKNYSSKKKGANNMQTGIRKLEINPDSITLVSTTLVSLHKEMKLTF